MSKEVRAQDFDPFYDGRTFYIRCFANGKNLDVDGNDPKFRNGGGKTQLWDVLSGDNQKWTLQEDHGRPSGSGRYQIVSKATGDPLSFLKAENGATALLDNHTEAIWLLQGVSTNRSGKFFKLVEAGSKKVLDADGANGANKDKNGTKVQLWDNVDSPNQIWELVEVK